MSAVMYAEPYKLPAGILAVAMHGALFAFLYFSVHWQAQPPQGMVVEIWESLPDVPSAPVRDVPPPMEKPVLPTPKAPPKIIEAKRPTPVAPPKVVQPKVVQPKTTPPKADIELADKKKPLKQEKEVVEPVVKENMVDEKIEREAQAERLAQAAKEAQAVQERAAQSAAIGKVINEHIGKIRAKIKRNIVEPRDLPTGIHGKFSITVLPGGSVLNVRLVKASGNAAYDNAVERAILKSQPLPVPEDVTLFQKFREINFTFCPDKGGGTCEE